MDLTILGVATRSVPLLNLWLQEKGCPQYAQLFKAAGERWGVRWDVCVFQACHETGYWKFGGDVRVEQNNFFGTGASGNGAPGDSFPSPEVGISAHMQNMALRAGKAIPVGEIISPYVRKNYEIISNRNTTMWSQLAGTYAGDRQYWEKIQAIMASFDAWAQGREPQPGAEQDTSFWAEDYGDGDLFLIGVPTGKARALHVTGNECAKLATAYAALAAAGAGKRACAPAGKQKPTVEPVEKPQPPRPTGKRVLLDPGHSEKEPGARGRNASVQEEDLNRYQAQLLQKELAALGITADIYDPLVDDLYAIGQRAQGYDAFVSLHLNAFKQREFYTCAMCHPSRQSPTSRSAKVASAWAKAVAAAIGNPLFGGTEGWPEGVMATGLSVLSGAASVGCPLFFLSEAEFIDDETTEGPIKERLVKAMRAGAKVLADALS